MSSEISIEEQNVKVSLVAQEELSSGEERPVSEWSSLEEQHEENVKKAHEKSLGSPDRDEICLSYVRLSDSTIIKHPYYCYPAVTDPGIEDALLEPKSALIYPDDGQELYLHLCSEMNICPVRIFYRNLLNPINSVKYYGINPRGVRAMAMALQNNKIVTCLDMTENFLSDDACYHLGEMLKYNTTLQELILDGCRIGKSGLLRLGENFYLNRTLLSLNLASNEIDDSGGVIFAKQVYTGFYVKKVNLSRNNLGRETALALVEGLDWQNPFTHLDLSQNVFTHTPSIVKLIEQLACSDALQELNLSSNSFEGERMAGAIYNILKIPTLKVLDLSRNRFQGEAINIIIPGLINAKKLITFNLSYNPMSPEDAYNALQIMLRPRVRLQKLLMENISVPKSFLTLLDRVSNMKSRKKFSVTYGYVLQNWTVELPDLRNILLKRADYLGNLNKKKPLDMPLYFMQMNKEYPKPISVKILLERIENDNIPLSEDFVKDLSLAFPGPKTKKSQTVDFNLISEYIARLWPDKVLPLTPLTEPESVPALEADLPSPKEYK